MAKKRIIIIISVVMVALFGFMVYWFLGKTPNSGALVKPIVSQSPRTGREQQAQPVRAVAIEQNNIPVYVSAIGLITPDNHVLVKSRVTGQLRSLHFSEGQFVKQGDLLAQIDPRSYQASLAQAQAQLVATQANLSNAQTDLIRFETLAKHNAIARQTVDSQRFNVEQLKAAVLADQAAIQSARLQVEYTNIVAPVGGRVGLRLVDVGSQIVANDSTGIVTITQDDSLNVVFSLPEAHLAQLSQAFDEKKPISVDVLDRNRRDRLGQGVVVSLDNQIDASTGTFKVRAEIKNSVGPLFSNQFVNVRVNTATLTQVLVVPSNAVQVGRQGTYVWRVDENNMVASVPVGVVHSFEEQSVITGDIVVGQLVVTDGVERLRQGVSVYLVGQQKTNATPAIQ